MLTAAKLQTPNTMLEFMAILLTGPSAYTIKPLLGALNSLVNNTMNLAHHIEALVGESNHSLTI